MTARNLAADASAHEPAPCFKDTNIPILSSDSALLQQQTCRDLCSIIYVAENEAPVFWDYVLPLARQLQKNERGVEIYGTDSPLEHLSAGTVSIFEVDAQTLTYTRLKSIVRGECGVLSELLRDPARQVIVYLHNVHSAKEDLRRLMTSFVEARFGVPSRDESNTHVVVSGVHETEMLKNVICPGLSPRCSMFALDS